MRLYKIQVETEMNFKSLKLLKEPIDKYFDLVDKPYDIIEDTYCMYSLKSELYSENLPELLKFTYGYLDYLEKKQKDT